MNKIKEWFHSCEFNKMLEEREHPKFPFFTKCLYQCECGKTRQLNQLKWDKIMEEIEDYEDKS